MSYIRNVDEKFHKVSGSNKRCYNMFMIKYNMEFLYENL